MSKEPPSQDFAKITQVPIRCHHFFEKNLHKGEINMDYASSLNHGDHGVATPVNQWRVEAEWSFIEWLCNEAMCKGLYGLVHKIQVPFFQPP